MCYTIYMCMIIMGSHQMGLVMLPSVLVLSLGDGSKGLLLNILTTLDVDDGRLKECGAIETNLPDFESSE